MLKSKKVFILLLVLLVYAPCHPVFANCPIWSDYSTLLEQYPRTGCPDPYLRVTRHFFGPYSSESDALSAAQQGPGSRVGNESFGVYEYVTFKVAEYCEQTLYQYAFCPDGGDCSCDDDSDGLHNWVDPWPDDPTDYKWTLLSFCKNSQGQKCFITVKWEDGHIDTFGDQACCADGQFYLEITPGTVWYNQSDLVALLGGDVVDQTAEEGNVSEITINDGEPTQTADNMQSGDDDTGNSTDGEKLTDIVNNTDKMTDNQQVMADYLKSINQKVGLMNQQLESLEVNANVDEEAIGDEVGQEIQDRIIGDSTQSSMESEVESAMSDVDSELDQYSEYSDEDFNPEYTEEQIPDEFEDYTDLEDQMNQSSQELEDVKDILEGSTVSTSGDCSFTWMYNGNPVEFGLCNYQTQLQTWGSIMLGIVGIHCLLIIFRRS